MTIPDTGLTFDAEVTRVIDGDTIEVETRIVHRVRLLDCWCEETRLGKHTTPAEKQDGLDAKAFLKNCLLEQSDNQVRVHIPGNGGDLHKLATLGRVLGRVWLRDREADTDISGLMVRAGHAKASKD